MLPVRSARLDASVALWAAERAGHHAIHVVDQVEPLAHLGFLDDARRRPLAAAGRGKYGTWRRPRSWTVGTLSASGDK